MYNNQAMCYVWTSPISILYSEENLSTQIQYYATAYMYIHTLFNQCQIHKSIKHTETTILGLFLGSITKILLPLVEGPLIATTRREPSRFQSKAQTESATQLLSGNSDDTGISIAGLSGSEISQMVILRQQAAAIIFSATGFQVIIPTLRSWISRV